LNLRPPSGDGGYLNLCPQRRGKLGVACATAPDSRRVAVGAGGCYAAGLFAVEEPRKEQPSMKSMRTSVCVGLVLFGLVLVNLEKSMGEEKAEEVKFPELPKGAGKIDKDAPKTFTETKSGLKYRILRKGDGAKPKATDKVEVNYQGWTDDGKVFDSSYKRGKSISFGLNQVIKGWTEGMQLVGEGGMIELEIPGKLAYGPNPPPGSGIPANATLHFLVELIEIK
jgi:FKBP-type peptidyl-prolyl cis-trans isomerase